MAEFQDIYQRYAQDVHRFALYLSGDQALAEDITSETFVRLWASDEKMIRMLTVKAYLFAIARHLYIDSRRSASRHVAIDPELPEPGTSPEMLAIYKSELREVLRLLQEIPEVDRAALLMHAQQGTSYEDIARVLGISLAAVKIKIHRARLRLAEARGRGSRANESIGGLQ
jgi:RNA polymerase sigma-70 factor (ECF subfamily)